MSRFLLAIVLLSALAVWSAQGAKKLIFVQELFRHGARYPIYGSNDDKTEYVAQEHSSGELTTQGKNMHYLLGKAIYNTYWSKLFGGTEFATRYNQTKFHFKSTDVNRTIESCQSHLMGIFENLPTLEITPEQVKYSRPLWPGVSAAIGEVFPTASKFHPMPIHVESEGTAFNNKGDFLRSYSPVNCPNQDVWKIQNQQTAFVKEIYNNVNFTKTLAELSRQVNKQTSFNKAGQYYDNFETTLYLGRPTLPIFSDPQYSRELDYMYTLDLYINLFHTPNQIRTTSSGFFEATIANIQRAIAKKDVQWVIYSAHDTTVGNMLAAMNLTNTACIYEAYLKGDKYNADTCVSAYPGYTASIIFQVYEDNDTTLQTFMVRYIGEYRKIPFCDYQTECPVSRLVEWFNSDIKVDNFAANCGLYNDDKQFYKAAAVLEFGAILVFVIGMVLRHLKRPKIEVNPVEETEEELAKEQAEQKHNLEEYLHEKEVEHQN